MTIDEFLRYLLLCLLALPLTAAVVVALLGARRVEVIRWISLATALAGLLAAAVLAVNFAESRQRDAGQTNPRTETSGRLRNPAGRTFDPRFVTRVDLVPIHKLLKGDADAKVRSIQFYVGLDGLNVWLVVLTNLLMVSSVLVSWNAIEERANEFYAWLLALGTGMLGVFLAFDIILFYAFFELTLVPLFFLIGIWGGSQRQHAARKFFIYTLTGSLITLLGVLGIVLFYYTKHNELTFSIPDLVKLVNDRLALSIPAEREYWLDVQFWVFLALAAGFAVKVPLVPLHTWLPLAHTEAPTAGSVLLAGVLLKIGAYGFLRLCLPLAPDASLSLGVPLIGTLGVIGVVYGAFCCLGQATDKGDFKRLVAYSSVSHLGFCMLGMFALNEAGLAGSLLQMINHGLSTGALFLLVGMLYERYHTRTIGDYGGMAARLKLFGCFMVFICLTSVGLPGLNGFVGEVLVLWGIYDSRGAGVNGPVLAMVAASGIVLGAWYLFSLLRRVFFGPVKEPHHEGHAPVADLKVRELAALVPIAAACLFIGLYPQPLLDAAKRDLKVVADTADAARARVENSHR